MNDSPLADTVPARMQGIRCEIDQDPEDLYASARSLVDGIRELSAALWAVCVRPSKLARTWIPLGHLSFTFRRGTIQRCSSGRSEEVEGASAS